MYAQNLPILDNIWEHAKPTLSKKELTRATYLIDNTSNYLRSLSKTIEGLACLIAHDTEENCKSVVGSFQDSNSVFNLLLTIHDSLEVARALIDIGSDAHYQLKKESEVSNAATVDK